MTGFRFSHPIEVRYGDVDAQGHVNNVVYFTYMEQARAKYLEHLGLWNGRDFLALGIILAEERCRFVAPIRYGQALQVGVRAQRLGNKSFEMVYSLQDAKSGLELAAGTTIQVAYDYGAETSVPIPPAWRKVLADFEGLDAAAAQEPGA
jgi:acyl-CoA thioester hydrolase